MVASFLPNLGKTLGEEGMIRMGGDDQDARGLGR